MSDTSKPPFDSPVANGAPTDRSLQRVGDGRDWVADVCRRFSDATGWPLTFSPYGEYGGNGTSPECCWSSVLTQRGKPYGRLHFDLPRDPGDDRGFLGVCEIAEVVAQLLTQTLSTTRLLEQQKQSTAILLDADATGASGQAIPALLKYLRAASELAEFRAAAFFMLSPDVRELHLRLTCGVKANAVPRATRLLAERPIDARALETGQVTVVANDESVYREWLPPAFRTGHCVPVQTDAGPAGTLWLFDRRKRTLDEDDRGTIAAIARRMGDALERVVLLRESSIHQRQTRDLEAASVAQRRAVGAQSESTERYELASICASRYEIGGDTCEVQPLDDNRLLFLVGDASGDSVPAAMVMSAVRGAVRSQLDDLRDERIDLARLMERTNDALCGLSANHQFMSMIVGTIDFAAGTLTWANAGHPPLLLARKGDVRQLSHHDLLLGVLPGTEFQTAQVPIQPGDRIIGFTDGIHEAMNPGGALLGIEGVASVVRSVSNRSAGEILASIQNRVIAHTGGEADTDDNTVMVLGLK